MLPTSENGCKRKSRKKKKKIDNMKNIGYAYREVEKLLCEKKVTKRE